VELRSSEFAPHLGLGFACALFPDCYDGSNVNCNDEPENDRG
jgi:hypothetical protein